MGTVQDRPRRQPRPEPRLVEGLQGDPSPCGGIQRGACPPLRIQRRESYPPPNPSHAQTLCEEGAALAREGDFIFHTLSFSKRATAPFETPEVGNERDSFIFRVFWAFMGDSPGRRKVTAAAGRGRILVRGPYCLRCASEAWQWRPSFLKNGRRKAGDLGKISCWVAPVGGGDA